MSTITQKVKEAVHPDKHSGPEESHHPTAARVKRAVHLRGDTDNDDSTTGEYMGKGNQAAGQLGGDDGPAPNTAGPHHSDMANVADPRVKSGTKGGDQDET